jgi:hypothetical protein
MSDFNNGAGRRYDPIANQRFAGVIHCYGVADLRH